MEDLPLEIRRVHHVGVDDAELPDARRRQVVRRGRAQATRADEQDLAAEQLVLAGLADLGDQEVAAVALRLLRRERIWRDPGHA